MNNLNKEYELLSKNIEELKCDKEKLELSLILKKEDRIAMQEKLFSLEKKNEQLTFERDNIVNIKNKIVTTIAEILAIVIALYTINTGVTIFSSISNIGMAAKILEGTGIFVGLGSAYLLVLNILVYINYSIKNKIKKADMNKSTSIELTKSIKANEKEMSEINQNLIAISNEITKLENMITDKVESIALIKKELEKIEKQIIGMEEEQNIEQTSEQDKEKSLKPYTRIRTR